LQLEVSWFVEASDFKKSDLENPDPDGIFDNSCCEDSTTGWDFFRPKWIRADPDFEDSATG
jgi:hypothetical protein